jgi:60 kDa SS-A/Ro ribonucleoprotein
MASINRTLKSAPVFTHEGARVPNQPAYNQLRRAVASCLLFEDQFYEGGQSIAERIANLVPQVAPEKVAQLAITARTDYKLRHVPLWLNISMLKSAKHKSLVANTLAQVIQRPDELTEVLALYWKDRKSGAKKKLARQLLKGIAKAFPKFNEYSLQKYNNTDKDITLRDALFLSHAKPKDAEQAAMWKRLIGNTLATPATWETTLSATQGEGKKEAWIKLLRENQLGGLAFLRNLRNMIEAGVSRADIRAGFATVNFSKVLPYRFIAAAKYAPDFEPELEAAMYAAVTSEQKLSGKTAILVDCSGSMNSSLSSKSDLLRYDAACSLAILLREICDDVDIMVFNTQTYSLPPRRGFALRDAMKQYLGGGTDGAQAVRIANTRGYDRIICLTDEQWTSPSPKPNAAGAYMVNVASAQNGVGYAAWTNISGFSEAIVAYIQEVEGMAKGADE